MIKIGLVFIIVFVLISLVSSCLTLLYAYIKYKIKYKSVSDEDQNDKFSNIKIGMIISEGVALLISIIPGVWIFHILNSSGILMGAIVVIRVILMCIRVRSVNKENLFELLNNQSAQDSDHAIYK